MIHAVIILILNYIIFHNDLPDSLHNIGRESIEDDERAVANHRHRKPMKTLLMYKKCWSITAN